MTAETLTAETLTAETLTAETLTAETIYDRRNFLRLNADWLETNIAAIGLAEL